MVFITDVSNTVCNVDFYLVVLCYCQDIRISGQCRAEEKSLPPLSIHSTDYAITRVIALRVIFRKTFTSCYISFHYARALASFKCIINVLFILIKRDGRMEL